QTRTAAELWRVLGATPRRQKLLATYLDTDDAALGRAHAALRLRRTGRRWLQCFKAEPPAGAVLLGRSEWELAARAGRLRVEAFPLDEIHASSGIDLGALEQRLMPVFTTQFERTTAGLQLPDAKVEVAFDRGTIVAGRRHETLREIEFELLEGEFLALLERVRALIPELGLELEAASKAERGYRLAAGARSAPAKARRPALDARASAQKAIAPVVGSCVAQVAANAHAAAAARDPEYLHQLRVGLRRLRSALRVFRRFALPERTQTLVDALRRVLPALGEARDWDVVTELLERRIAPAAGQALELAATLRWARRRRARARHAARAVAGSSAFQQLLLDAMIWAEQAGREAAGDARAQEAALAPGTPPRPSTLTAYARRRVTRLARRVEQAGDGCDWSDAGARHQLRIRLKRLRYACEFFAVCFKRKRMRRYLEHLEALQDVLGELNDIATARALCAEPLRVTDVQGAFVSGWLAAREGALVSALADGWRAFRDQARPA
ncbi:MAG TPA: CHAD domain-containing protein, partial [Burkholderiales bacterium]|nr:CHAD domain-containing protein [Burkholderiales bacterium]